MTYAIRYIYRGETHRTLRDYADLAEARQDAKALIAAGWVAWVEQAQ